MQDGANWTTIMDWLLKKFMRKNHRNNALEGFVNVKL